MPTVQTRTYAVAYEEQGIGAAMFHANDKEFRCLIQLVRHLLMQALH